MSQWLENPECVLDAISTAFKHRRVIVRSSTQSEDSSKESLAGAFQSILNVSTKDTSQLKEAIQTVIDSYGVHHEEDQFFIQEFLSDIEVSGVIFTRDINSLAPYYVVNYDDTSGRTDTVTSGSSGTLQTFVSFRESPEPPSDRRWNSLMKAAKEIEELTGADN